MSSSSFIKYRPVGLYLLSPQTPDKIWIRPEESEWKCNVAQSGSQDCGCSTGCSTWHQAYVCCNMFHCCCEPDKQMLPPIITNIYQSWCHHLTVFYCLVSSHVKASLDWFTTDHSQSDSGPIFLLNPSRSGNTVNTHMNEPLSEQQSLYWSSYYFMV